MTLSEIRALVRTIVERHALVCAVCLYAKGGGKAKTALTVIEGYAVCENHLGFVAQGARFASIYGAVEGQDEGQTA